MSIGNPADTPPTEEPAFLYITYIASPLSIIASTVMLYLCLKRETLTIIYKLLATLAASDLLYCVTGLMNLGRYTEDSPWCKIEACSNLFFYTSTIIVICSISLLHYKLSTLTFDPQDTSYLKKTIVIGLLLSLLLSIGPLYTSKIIVHQLPEDKNCHQKTASDVSVFVQFILFTFLNGPTFGGLVLCIVLYILAARKIKNFSKVLGRKTNIETSLLFWYPFVMFIFLVPFSLKVIFTYLMGRTPMWMELAVFAIWKSIGLINATIYILQRKLYRNQQQKTSVDKPINLLMNHSDSYEQEKSVVF